MVSFSECFIRRRFFSIIRLQGLTQIHKTCLIILALLYPCLFFCHLICLILTVVFYYSCISYSFYFIKVIIVAFGAQIFMPVIFLVNRGFSIKKCSLLYFMLFKLHFTLSDIRITHTAFFLFFFFLLPFLYCCLSELLCFRFDLYIQQIVGSHFMRHFEIFFM